MINITNIFCAVLIAAFSFIGGVFIANGANKDASEFYNNAQKMVAICEENVVETQTCVLTTQAKAVDKEDKNLTSVQKIDG